MFYQKQILPYTLREIRELFRDNKSPHGLSCVYIKWTNRTGIKVYVNSTFAHVFTIWFRQAYAAKHGLGPLVGKLYKLFDQNDVFVGYGYETEHVFVLKNYTRSDDDQRLIYLLAENKIPINKNDILKPIRMFNCDDHGGNYGFKLDGTFVCLDFDNTSIPNELIHDAVFAALCQCEE